MPRIVSPSVKWPFSRYNVNAFALFCDKLTSGTTGVVVQIEEARVVRDLRSFRRDRLSESGAWLGGVEVGVEVGVVEVVAGDD
jgi:hypothetical protein